ncbi:MAG TPA: suppressor of fused domain protein, partial [Verrucomicrobiae bacterium]
MATTEANWGDAFYDHMLRYLGSPVSRKIFRQNETSPFIQVLKFDNAFPGCKVFCSLGASNYSEVLGRPSEVILPCDNGWDAAEDLLANSLFFLVQERMELGSGVAIKLDRLAAGFAGRFAKTAIYFTDPFGLPS